MSYMFETDSILILHIEILLQIDFGFIISGLITYRLLFNYLSVVDDTSFQSFVPREPRKDLGSLPTLYIGPPIS